jgi:hypothetical protein
MTKRLLAGLQKTPIQESEAKWTASVCFKKNYEVSLLHVCFSCILITTWNSNSHKYQIGTDSMNW